jgi:hypothetical protein
MVSYSTNFMGPISTDWYKQRGYTKRVVKVIDSDFLSQIRKQPLGTKYEVDEITEEWAGGRIDIYGLDPKENWGGKGEYSLPVMRAESWGVLTEWLDDFESEELLKFDDLINTFETETGHKIEWEKSDAQ